MYGTVTSSDGLMQDVLQLKQIKSEKVQTIMTRIEESLSRIRVRFPGRIVNGVANEYLKDHLFHGMHKSIRDSVHYLYDDKRVEYVGLLKAARKTTDEHEEVKHTISKAAMTHLSVGEVYSPEYYAMTDQINILKGMIQSKDLNKGNVTDKNGNKSNHYNTQSHYGKNDTHTWTKTQPPQQVPLCRLVNPCNVIDVIDMATLLGYVALWETPWEAALCPPPLTTDTVTVHQPKLQPKLLLQTCSKTEAHQKINHSPLSLKIVL